MTELAEENEVLEKKVADQIKVNITVMTPNNSSWNTKSFILSREQYEQMLFRWNWYRRLGDNCQHLVLDGEVDDKGWKVYLPNDRLRNFCAKEYTGD